MDVDSQPVADVTILVGEDLMMGPPSPIIPPEIASHVLDGVNLCDGLLRNLFLCLQINDIEPFCQDEFALYQNCVDNRDKELRVRLNDSERKLGYSMPVDDAEERVAQLQSQVTTLERDGMLLRRLSSAVCTSSGDHCAAVKPLIPPLDRHRRRISELLAADGWATNLDLELSAGRLDLNPKSVISILQHQESPSLLLKFYLWAAAAAPSLSKTPSLLAVLRRNLRRTGPLVLSPRLLEEIRSSNLLLDEQTLCLLISAWGSLGLPNYCLDIFNQISFLNIPPSTKLYNSAIKALVASNSLNLAYLHFHRMPSHSCAPDTFTYNALIHGVSSAGIPAEALRLLRQMHSSGLPPNSHTFSILIHGLCNSGRVDSAFKILRRMRERRAAAVDVPLATLIRGVLRRASSPRAALRRIAALLDDDDGGGAAPLPLTLFCDVVLSSLAERRMHEEAALFLKKVEGLGYVVKNATFNIIMTCFIRGGLDLEETCAVFDSFTARGGAPAFDTYLLLVEALFRRKMIDQGERYLKEMVEGGFMGNAYSCNMVVDRLQKLGMVEMGWRVVMEMQDRGVDPSLVTFNTLISAFCKDGAVDRATEMLRLLLRRGLDPDVFTFTSLIDGLCRAGRPREALECHAEMRRWGVRPSLVTYNVLVRSFCREGDVRRAGRVVEEMKGYGVDPDVYTFNAMIEGFGRLGMVDEARRAFDSMQCVGVCPDNYTYSAIIGALFRSGRMEEAEGVYRSMEGGGCSPDLYTIRLFRDALKCRKIGRRFGG